MLEGELQTLLLPDLLQWLSLTRRSGKLAVTQAKTHSLELYFTGGEIAAASISNLTVLDSPEKVRSVLGFALTWRAGRFLFQEETNVLKQLPVNLHLSTESLLNEIARANSAENGGQLQRLETSDTFTLADSLRFQVVDHLLKEDFTVPSMPQLATRVLELTSNDNFSLRELSVLVQTDQAVTARILRYANSVFYGAGREVDSLPQAVQRLGGNEVFNIVLATSLQARRAGPDLFAAQKRKLWMSAAASAYIGRKLATKAKLNGHTGFLCGLLMDFGSTVIYSLLQTLMNKQPEFRATPPQYIEEINRDCHARLGRTVAERWRLPLPVIEAMAYHHCFGVVGSDTPYVAVAALTDYLTTLALSVPPPALPGILASLTPEGLAAHPAAQMLNLGPREMGDLLEELPDTLKRSMELVLD